MYTKKLNYKKLLEDFLNYKRSCGYKYNSEEITLKSFYNYTKEYLLSSQGLTKEFLETKELDHPIEYLCDYVDDLFFENLW